MFSTHKFVIIKIIKIVSDKCIYQKDLLNLDRQ